MDKKIYILSTEDEILSHLAQKIQTAATNAISQQNIFKIGLSGGSMVKQLAKIFPTICTDWSKWRFFFCDERMVPFDDSESTFGAYLKAFKNVTDIKEDQFVTINPDLSAEEAAKDYIKKLSIYFPPNDIPKFDLLLLGMGPDGHTCSLFPGHPLLEESSVWVAPIVNSPKPPPCRITLTFPVINNAQISIFIIIGESKAPVIKKILEDNEPLPAQRVQPSNGNVLWFLDKAAASQLTSN
ncbi:hypothetical protein PGB90_001327 [Kerria lacca]